MKDIIVFSHLRWNFVFQRPQHIMSRLARQYRIIFIEEAIQDEAATGYDRSQVAANIWTVQPHLNRNEAHQPTERLRKVLDQIMSDLSVTDFAAWYYTPMAYDYSRHLQPRAIVYDCMDELSAFLHAPAELISKEAALLAAADVVFTGGISLYEAKKHRHPAVYCMPSSIDKTHFGRARQALPEPADQAGIGFPRLGFFGVIDERFDGRLLAKVAETRPDWQFVLLGPVVKIAEKDLPHAPNIHYPGMKTYDELPAYLSNWQIALLPFAINEATAYISPTKTPEYLAAGKPVISSPIKDVVRSYGKHQLVSIAGNSQEFIAAAEALLQHQDEHWLERVDAFLSTMSWDTTVAEMDAHVQQAVSVKKGGLHYV